MDLPHLDYLRNLQQWTPEAAGKLYETLKAVVDQSKNTETQANLNPKGQPIAPPAVSGVSVTTQNGFHSVAITDNNPKYRGVQYYAEHDTDPQFGNPQVVHLGSSRNYTAFHGNSTLYWRAYSSYAGSPPSEAVYHGSSTTPTPAVGGGTQAPPAYSKSQGSGTGKPGQGLVGPGVVPFISDKNNNGIPPQR